MKKIFSINNFQVPLVWIVGINLLLKLCMFYGIHHGQNLGSNRIENVNIDEASYDFIAHQIIEHGTFAPPSDTMYKMPVTHGNIPFHLQMYHDMMRLPGYPLFVATMYTITGARPLIAILIQILLSLFSVVLVYKMCMLFSDNKSIASLAGLLYAIDMHSNYISALLLADTLVVTCMLAAAYYIARAIVRHKAGDFIISSVFMALACIIRPVMLLYPCVLLFLFFVFSKDKAVQKIKLCLVYVVITCSFAMAWSARNHRVYNHWGLTIESGELLAMWSAAFSEARATHQNVDTVRAEFQKQADSMHFNSTPNIFDKAGIYEKLGYTYFKNHKLEMIVSQFIGGLHMYLSIGNIDMGTSFGWHTSNIRGYPEMSVERVSKNFSSKKEAILAVIILLVLFLQYAGALAGMVQLLRTHNYLLVLLCVLTILYFTAVTGIIGMYRYKLPVVPSICILAGYGYYYLLSLKKGKTA